VVPVGRVTYTHFKRLAEGSVPSGKIVPSKRASDSRSTAKRIETFEKRIL